MKKMLAYGKHFLRARGRHGTHSPFVYAFVEQVLRSKERFSVNNAVAFSRKEMNLLARTIKYLKPSCIIADAELISLLKEIVACLKQTHITFTPFNTASNNLVEEGSTLLISQNKNKSEQEFLTNALKHHNVFVIQLGPHALPEVEENWYGLCALPEVKMRLDLWYFGLLVNGPSFKGSQYFRLR